MLNVSLKQHAMIKTMNCQFMYIISAMRAVSDDKQSPAYHLIIKINKQYINQSLLYKYILMNHYMLQMCSVVTLYQFIQIKSTHK